METYELESDCSDSEDHELVVKKVSEELQLIQKLLDERVIQLNKDHFPLLTQHLNNYFHENRHLLQNTLIHNFLENDEHLIILICSLYNMGGYKKLLDQKFKEFYFEYRYVAYISKVLYFKSIHFDSELRKHSQREALVLDQSNDEDSYSVLDFFGTEDEYEFSLSPLSLSTTFSDEAVARALETITVRQKLILYMAYVYELKDVEIAKKLKISQQSVSKTRKNGLSNIRKLIGGN